jgi:DNA (cytosine-5)-methyltransferase 1
MRSAKPLFAADLFCGAGGTSTGLFQAAELVGRRVELTAVNHWERAVETHAANHPRANHICQDLARLKPAEAVPGGKLDLLVASPECTHHSVARGGKPKCDQSRASAWVVMEWVTALQVRRVLIENVPEFVTWGPLGADGKPLRSKRGHLFHHFVGSLRAAGYTVEWRVMNAADFGAATSRRRLFIQAVKGRGKIHWPHPSNASDPSPGLFGSLPRWRAAREVIDWSMKGESIFGRKRPLSENTLKRIEAGLRKFGGKAAEPFITVMNYLSSRGHDERMVVSMDDPLPTVTGGNRFYLTEPFVQGTGNHNANGKYVYPVGKPLPTITSADDLALVEPFIVPANYGERPGQTPRTHAIDRPVPTVTAGGVNHGLVEPMILSAGGPRSAARPVSEPVPTLMTRDRLAVAEPFIVPHRMFDREDVDSVDRPLRTITATNGRLNGVCEPFVVPYYRTGVPDSVNDPLSTITTRDRLGLVEPDGFKLDILFRMLQPHELAAAMGFPAGYRITGNRAEQVRQIGNAVEVNQARALCSTALEVA